MIKITKPLLQKALIAGFFSAFTIGVLTVLTYKSTLGYFIAASFGSSMVLLFGFPESFQENQIVKPLRNQMRQQ